MANTRSASVDLSGCGWVQRYFAEDLLDGETIPATDRFDQISDRSWESLCSRFAEAGTPVVGLRLGARGGVHYVLEPYAAEKMERKAERDFEDQI